MADAEVATVFAMAEFIKVITNIKIGGVEQINFLMKRNVSELDKTELNIAVTGETGAGKSAFINAMRGLRNNDDGAAKVGITETTMEPAGFPHPIFSNVCYWDLPGIGSTQFPSGKYVKKMKFEMYDFFIIISAGCFKENDAKLAEEIKQLGKDFYFVRTKIDQDFYSMRKGGGNKINEEEKLDDIRSNCIRRLREVRILIPSVFLISSFERDRYDFNRLNKTLEDDLPYIKKSFSVLTYANRSVEIVQQKSKMLQKDVWTLAKLSLSLREAAIPGLSLADDFSILKIGIIYFRKCLGLDEASLQKLANITNKPVEKLKAVVKTPLQGERYEDVLIMLARRAIAVGLPLEVGLYSVPAIHSCFAAGSSFLMSYTILTDALKDLTESAERVVKVAYGID
ncbi:interferon-inducible GTPase 5-like isoform X2 [Mobula birostris]